MQNDSPTSAQPKLLKVIACEIAVRELCHIAATSPSIVDFEFLTQGYHDTPAAGRVEIQKRIDAVPEGKFDAIVLGYGLCSSILTGLTTAHTPLIIPRAHDCITFFLGSKERYQEFFDANPGTYYYTSGWLECARRRNMGGGDNRNIFLPAHSQAGAKYLMEVMGEWTANYSHGTLIDFDFTKPLKLKEQVQQICADRKWTFSETEGHLGLLRRLLDGDWRENEVLVVKPGQKVGPVFDGNIIGVE